MMTITIAPCVRTDSPSSIVYGPTAIWLNVSTKFPVMSIAMSHVPVANMIVIVPIMMGPMMPWQFCLKLWRFFLLIIVIAY